MVGKAQKTWNFQGRKCKDFGAKEIFMSEEQAKPVSSYSKIEGNFLESSNSGVARLEQPRPLVPTGTQRLGLWFPRVIKE